MELIKGKTKIYIYIYEIEKKNESYKMHKKEQNVLTPT